MDQPTQSDLVTRTSLEAHASSERWLSRWAGNLAWLWPGSQQTELSRGFWILGDQAVVSLTNFATTLIIGRLCLKTELGLYTLGFALVMYLSGIPKALIWSPYTAFCPSMDSQQRAEYTASSTLQLLAIAVVALTGLATTGAILGYGSNDWQLARLFGVLAPAALFMMLRDHVRRLCLAWRDVADVFRFDVLVSVLQISGLIFLVRTGFLSGTTAYLAAIFASLASLVWLYLRRKNFSWNRLQWTMHLAKNWHFAKWLFGGAVAVLAEQGLYYWSLPYFHDIAAVGVLAASQSVVAFANPVLLGLANYCGPAAATTFAQQGLGAMYRSVRWSSAVLLGFVALFFLGILLWADPIVVTLFGTEFAGNAQVTIAMALGLLSRAMLIPIELGFLAIQRGRFLFFTAIFRLAVTLTLGLALVVAWGAAGVGYGIFVGNTLVLAWEWIEMRRIVRHA